MQNQLLNTQLKSLMDSEEAQKKDRLIKERLVYEENLKQKFLTEHLKDENTQLKYQLTTNENKWENLYNKTIDSFSKQLKDSEEAHRKELYDMQLKVQEHKKDVAKILKDTEEAHRKEMLENEDLRDEENIKHNALTEKLQEEIAQLKDQLTLAHEKQATEREALKDSVKNLQHKELNAREEIYEKRINKVIDTFNKQLKDSEDHLQHKVQEHIRAEVKDIEEALRKELYNMQLKTVDEHKKEFNKKLTDSEEVCRKEFYDMQLKVEQLRKEEAKKLEDTKEAHKKEIYNLQVKVEEHKKEVTKTLKDSAETHRKEMLENIQLRDEENIKHNALTEKLQEEITQLKDQLTFTYEKQATEREALQDSVKNLHHKELNAREEIYEKRINSVISTFNKQLKDSEDHLQHKVQEHIKEEVKKLENIEEALRKELYDLPLKIVNEYKKEVNKKFKDSEETHRKKVYNLQLKVEEFIEEEAKKLKDSEETYRNNLTLMVKKLIRKEVKSLEEHFNEQNSLTESNNKALVTKENFMSKLEDLKANSALEVFEEKSRKDNDAKPKPEPAEYIKPNIKSHKKKDINNSKIINEKSKELFSIDANGLSLNPDVLALMQKTGVYQHPALSYDVQTATININCDDPTVKEKVKEELLTAYRELMMGGKLKEHAFPIDDIQQANVIVDECSKVFNHTYFRYVSEKKEIKCLSTDARQMQNVRRRFICIKNAQKVKSVYLDLPKMSRKVTIKLGDITEEEVDIIVNAANDHLVHAGGVAGAIDKASYGAVQKESIKLIKETGTLPTGEAVITTAGGKLKCNFVVHAVEPKAYEHKDQCGPLLRSACVNSMLLAQHNKAKSISFPPISSGLFGVSKELVANVMLSSLCSYTCSDPELLNDVRIVIIDDPTFDVFLKIFNKEKGNLELLQNIKPPTDVSMSTTYQHSMQVGNAPQLGSRKDFTNLVCIDLPELGRRVTIKLGDIVQEKVDVIVNSANNQLLHNEGVAAAINKASGGEIQREAKYSVTTGDAVATNAGGTLKCKFVIHAVGPTVLQHKDQCGSLLKKACISAMNVAKNFEAISIAFPPISSGTAGLSNELVANVMLSTLCSYKCSNPTLLSDVRIVIIDKPTFEVFLNTFHKIHQSLEQIHTNLSITDVIKPATFEYDSSGGNLFLEASQSSTSSKSKQHYVSYTKYLPLAKHLLLTTGDGQTTLQKEQNSESRIKEKENKKAEDQKIKSKFISYIMLSVSKILCITS